MTLVSSKYSLVSTEVVENDDVNKGQNNDENNLHLSSDFYVSCIMKTH